MSDPLVDLAAVTWLDDGRYKAALDSEAWWTQRLMLQAEGQRRARADKAAYIASVRAKDPDRRARRRAISDMRHTTTLERTAEAFGISPERVRQICRRVEKDRRAGIE